MNNKIPQDGPPLPEDNSLEGLANRMEEAMATKNHLMIRLNAVDAQIRLTPVFRLRKVELAGEVAAVADMVALSMRGIQNESDDISIESSRMSIDNVKKLEQLLVQLESFIGEVEQAQNSN